MIHSRQGQIERIIETNGTTEFRVDQYDLAYPEGIENHWWHLARNAIVLHEARKFIKPDSVVLDVGCGRGIAVKCFRRRGINCRGVELAETQALKGMEVYIRYGINASQLSLGQREQVDVILLLDVLEHIPDPALYLYHLVSAFPHLKYLILTVPSRQELWSNYDEFYGHFHRYDMKMVQNMARAVDGEVVRQSYFFRPLYIPMRLLNYLKIQRHTKLQNGMAPWMNHALSYLMLMDWFLLPSAVPGSSLLACLRLSATTP